MKFRKIILLSLCAVVICVCSCLLFLQHQSKKSQTFLDLTEAEKLSDFEALCEILDESYPFWHEVAQAGIDKASVYDTYRSDIKNTDTDIEFFKYLGYFLNEFDGLGHLSALDGYMYGIYMDALSESHGVLSAQEETRISPLRKVLENPISRNTYGQLDQSHSGFRSTIGLKEKYETMEAKNEPSLSEIVTSIYNEQTAYLKIDSFELANYQKDRELLESFFAQIKEIPNLILDLRDNSGGSDLYWEDLIVKPNAREKLVSERYFLFNQSKPVDTYISALGISTSKISDLPESLATRYGDHFTHYAADRESFEASEAPYPGKIWVLIDDTVYSASENFVMFCKNTGFATLVGTPTGGDGGIADPLLFSLPNSGMIVRFSVFYGLNNDGSSNEALGTTPDVMVSEGDDALDICLGLLAG